MNVHDAIFPLAGWAGRRRAARRNRSGFIQIVWDSACFAASKLKIIYEQILAMDGEGKRFIDLEPSKIFLPRPFLHLSELFLACRPEHSKCCKSYKKHGCRQNSQNLNHLKKTIDISNVLKYSVIVEVKGDNLMTIKDIARNLNVSYSTVSLCLNNDPRVSEKTKKRVLEEADRIGFTFNANARSLVMKKTNRIGIIFSDNFNAHDYRWFFNEIETYSTRALQNCGYDYLIQPNTNIHSQSNIFRMMNGKMVDGLVIFSKTITKAEYDFLCKSSFPYVYVYFKPPFADDCLDNFFWDDNETGGYLATKHLLDHGHRKILTIRSNDPELKMYDERTNGYFKAMKEYDAEPAILETRMDFESQPELVRLRNDYLRQFTAIFSQQDLPALSIVQQLQKHYGVRVPEDLSVVGYNDIELIRYLDIPLDTIADPREAVISNAVNSLICRIEKKEDVYPRKIYPRLIVRGSVRNLEQSHQ